MERRIIEYGYELSYEHDGRVFCAGDIVEANCDNPQRGLISAGDTGVIVAINPNDNHGLHLGVCWHKEIVSGHDLGLHGKYIGHGWWVDYDDVSVIMPIGEDAEFEPIENEAIAECFEVMGV